MPTMTKTSPFKCAASCRGTLFGFFKIWIFAPPTREPKNVMLSYGKPMGTPFCAPEPLGAAPEPRLENAISFAGERARWGDPYLSMAKVQGKST
jgi:hypothetical protein